MAHANGSCVFSPAVRLPSPLPSTQHWLAGVENTEEVKHIPVPRVTDFSLPRIALDRGEIHRELYSVPRIILRHLSSEVRFVQGVTFFVVGKGASQAWHGLAAVAEAPFRSHASRQQRKVTIEPSLSAQELFDQALAHQEKLNFKAALLCLQEARAKDPDNPAILCLASKQWSDHSFLPGITRADVVACNKLAIMLARKAQELNAQYSLGHTAECICKGRLAFFERNPRRILELAKEAQEAAYTALECNPNDDVAHHLIGRWNVGMATLNFMIKSCIKYVFGTQFRPGTMDTALDSYNRAKELRPDRIIHGVELARVLHSLNQHKAAVTELRKCYELPLEDINARQMLEEGTILLEKWDPSFKLDSREKARYDYSFHIPALECAGTSLEKEEIIACPV